jgi:hypothetical protein
MSPIDDRTAAIKQVADNASESLDYFYLNLGLNRPSNEDED